MNELDARIDTLSDKKRALLERLMQAKGLSPQLAPLPVEPRSNPKPQELATFTQKRVYRLQQQQHPGRAVANISFALRLHGRLGVAEFVRSLERIVERHEALRTNFYEEDGTLWQQIHPQDAHRLAVQMEEQSSLSAEEREAYAKQLAEEEANYMFDLAQESLIRSRLVQFEETDHAWYFTVHHIVFDGWSIGVFFRELALLYDALLQGQGEPLEALAFQYGDFAHWQQQWLDSGHHKQRAQEWKQRMQNLPSQWELEASDRQTLANDEPAASLEVMIDHDLAQKIKELCNQEGTTLYMTLFSAYAAVLMQHHGSRDIVIGTPIAGRIRSQFENLIGMFVNVIPMRAQASSTATFRELLQHVKALTVESFARQEIPTTVLMEDLQVPLNGNRPPLFPFLFTLQNAPGSDEPFVGLDLAVIRREQWPSVNPVLEFYCMPGSTPLDVSLVMSERAAGIAGLWEYNQASIAPNTVTQLAADFEALLRQAVEQPDMPLHIGDI